MPLGRAAAAIVCFSVLTGCAATADPDASFLTDRRFVVTYYDRDGDGRADFASYELPDSSHSDWALVDTDFDGRFDRKLRYGNTVGEYPTSILVPRAVKIAGRRPPDPMYPPKA